MAVFNPEVPVTKDPDWKKDFRPISDIPANKTAGMALSLLGNTIEGVTGLVDTGIKKSLSDEAYAKADIAQGVDQSFLEGQRAELTNEKLPTNRPVTLAPDIKGTPSLINNNGEDPEEKPQGLTSGISQVNRLGAAAKSNPGLNDTWYSMMADSTAKDLRARFPGYREYIDQVTSQAFGVNVANAYRNNLRSDVNHLMTQLNSGKDAELAEFRKRSDIPGFTGLYNQLEQNPNNMDLRYRMRSIVNTYDAAKAKNANKLTELQVKAAEGKATSDDYYQTISSSIATASEFNFTNSLKTIGLDNPDILNQPDNIKAAKMSEFGTRLAVERHQANLDLENRLNMKLPDGRVLRSVLGETYVKNIRDDQNYRYDSLMTLLNGNKPENFAAVYHTANMFKATVDDEARSLQKHPVIGLPATRLSAMNKLLDPQLTGALGLDIFVKNALGTDMGNWLVGEKLAAATNSGRPAGTAGGAPNETKRIADTIKVLKNELRINPDTGIYEEIFKTLDILTHPKATVENKKNVIDYFSAINQDSTYLSNFEFDKGIIGGEGKIIGRGAAFTVLTAPKVVEAVKTLPQEYQDKYRQTIQNMFLGDITREDINTVNGIEGTPLRLEWNDGSDKKRPIGFTLTDPAQGVVYTPTWVKENQRNQFLTATPPGSPASIKYRGAYQAEALYRINEGLKRMAEVYKGFGDPRPISDIMLEATTNTRLNMPATTTGLPNPMTKAIIEKDLERKKKPEERAKELFDTSTQPSALNFGPEDKPLTLGGWLSGLNSLRENVKPPAGPIIAPPQEPVQAPTENVIPPEIANNPGFSHYDPATGRYYMRNTLSQDAINKDLDAKNRANRVQALRLSDMEGGDPAFKNLDSRDKLYEEDNIDGVSSFKDWRRSNNVEDRRKEPPVELNGDENFGGWLLSDLDDNPLGRELSPVKTPLQLDVGIRDIIGMEQDLISRQFQEYAKKVKDFNSEMENSLKDMYETFIGSSEGKSMDEIRAALKTLLNKKK